MHIPPTLHRSLCRATATTLALLACALPVSGCSTAAAQRATPASIARSARVDSALAVATFDSAWNRIRISYYDSTFRGHDWTKLRDELRHRAASAHSMDEVRTTIRTMFERLGDSHFMLIPASVVERWTVDTAHIDVPGDVGLEFRIVDGLPMVSRVAPRSPSDLAGVMPGWVIERIGAVRIDSLMRAHRAEATRGERGVLAVELPLSIMGHTVGQSGSSVRLVFRDASGRRVEHTLVRRPSPGFDFRVANLPPQHIRIESERRLDRDGCIGLIRFNAWVMPVMARIDAAVDDLRACRAIVIDLRGNTGGVAAMVMGVAGHFLDSTESLGTLTSRGLVMHYISNPRRTNPRGAKVTPFHGALAILVDGLSVSTSEIFAAGMQQLGRAHVFGEVTPGDALPSSVTKLPNGDVMQYVIADFTLADGRRLEGRGVTPDVVIPLRRLDLLGGHDVVLDSALRWIGLGSTHTALSRP